MVWRRYIAVHSKTGTISSLQVSTASQVWQLAQQAVDGTKPEQQPVSNTAPGAYIYFVVVTIICGYLLLNMVIGVIIDEYMRIKVRGLYTYPAATRKIMLNRLRIMPHMFPSLSGRP